MCSAIGVYNQFIHVHPAHEVTIVKLSANRLRHHDGRAQNREGETLAFLKHRATVAAGH